MNVKMQILKCALFLGVFGCISCQTATDLTLSGLKRENFQKALPEGNTDLYVLKNKAGMEVCITNFGGRIVSVMAPDKNGVFADVVLGHDSVADYVNIDGNFGALIGRYGNRIGLGKFTLDSVEYQLPQNNYGHCLHGGPAGFHNRVWTANQVINNELTLTYLSKDKEEGFPGNLNVVVTYILNDDNALEIKYVAETDQPTIVNLTNHAYFNLSGQPDGTIQEHIVQLDADAFTPVDSTFMTTGEILAVEGTPMDFRQPKTIGQDIASDDIQLAYGKGYDHNWVLNTAGDITRPACKVTDPVSGRVLEVFTTEPGIQFYTGNFLDGTVKGKKGIAYPFRSAMCLESQHYPDSPNKIDWPSVVVRPGEVYKSECIYKFSVEE